jgi:hypothetical protein
LKNNNCPEAVVGANDIFVEGKQGFKNGISFVVGHIRVHVCGETEDSGDYYCTEKT